LKSALVMEEVYRQGNGYGIVCACGERESVCDTFLTASVRLITMGGPSVPQLSMGSVAVMSPKEQDYEKHNRD